MLSHLTVHHYIVLKVLNLTSLRTMILKVLRFSEKQCANFGYLGGNLGIQNCGITSPNHMLLIQTDVEGAFSTSQAQSLIDERMQQRFLTSSFTSSLATSSSDPVYAITISITSRKTNHA